MWWYESERAFYFVEVVFEAFDDFGGEFLAVGRIGEEFFFR